jgi:hypothetical protein
VTQLWLPPPSQSVSKQGYLPGQLYDLNTPYGSEAQLRKLLKEARSAGIAPLADIVINHRCADEQDEHGRWNIFTCEPPPLFRPPAHHHRFTICCLHRMPPHSLQKCLENACSSSVRVQITERQRLSQCVRHVRLGKTYAAQPQGH